MANDMNEITLRIGHWLKANNIDPDSVRVILEFPGVDVLYQAEAAIKRETEPYKAHYITGGTFGAIEKMNGLGLSLQVNPANQSQLSFTPPTRL